MGRCMKAKGATTVSREDKRHGKPKTQKADLKQAATPRVKPVHYLSAALVVLCFAVYANSLGNDFVFDDNPLILGSRQWLKLANLFDLARSYRPVRNLSYAFDLALWGDRPFGFHLTNVLIHCGVTVLIFLLVRRLTERPLPAFLTALIFAVHPIQTDAVAYISGRRDVLFGFFFVAAFLSYLIYRSRNAKLYFVLFLALWALSLLSKEMAVSLPAVIFVWNFCDEWGKEATGSWVGQSAVAVRKAIARDKWLYAALGISGAAYVSYMIFVQGSSGRATSAGLHYWGGSFWTNLLMALRVHGWYLKQLILPTPIAQYYGAFDISQSPADPRVLLSLAVVGALLFSGFALLRKHKLMAFAILSYFAMLLPVSQIIPHHELLADHYLYLPIMSFGLLVSLLIERLSAKGAQHRQVAYAAAAVIVIILGVLTVRRNQDWKNEFTVWQANYEAVPNSPRAAHNLGGMYLKSNPQRAEELFKQALAADPNFEPAYLSLARLYVTQKRIPEAEDLIQRGLVLADAQTGSYILRNTHLLRSQLTTVLAAAKWEAGERGKTEELLWQAVNFYPANGEAYDSLANLYEGKDRIREIDVLRRALANVSSYEIRARLASLLIEDKRYDEAATCLQGLLAMTPGRADCRKAGTYLNSARTAVGRAMELREMDAMLRTLVERCGP
jgi:tetratricopeptide (TPR) repeat protein